MSEIMAKIENMVNDCKLADVLQCSPRPSCSYWSPPASAKSPRVLKTPKRRVRPTAVRKSSVTSGPLERTASPEREDRLQPEPCCFCKKCIP